MRKKLLRLTVSFLAVTLFIMNFAGCQKRGEGEMDEQLGKEASRYTTTLNMLVMTEDGTDKEQAEAVAKAINKITKSRFKTKLNIQFVEEKDYYKTLEASFANKAAELELAAKAEKSLKKYVRDHKAEYGHDGAIDKFYEEFPEYSKFRVTTADPEAETTPEETIFNEETGLLELKYPEADPNIIDIFFIQGEDRLKEYAEKEWVAGVDDELTTSSKKLNDFVSPAFLKSAKIDNTTYAVPNNRTVGEYTYMMINKKLAEKYYYDPKSFTDMMSCRDFLEDIDKFEKDVVPIDGEPGVYNVLYWNIDPETLEINRDKFSVIGATYAPAASYGSELQFSSLFATKKQYKDQLLTNKLYEERGYFRKNVPADAECAVRVIKGGAELEKVYAKDYEMVILEYPRAHSEDVFKSMFAVSGHSNYVTRAMEIITYLNTNEDMRNLLQYGIKDVNYTLDENKQVTYTPQNKYFMDVEKTGNVFLAYPMKGTDPDLAEYSRKQNREATVDFILGFSLKQDPVDVEVIGKINKLTADAEARLAKCATYDELSALIDELSLELKPQNNSDIKRYVTYNADPLPKGGDTPYVLFFQWLDSHGFIIRDE